MSKKGTLNYLIFCFCTLFLLIVVSFGQTPSTSRDPDQSNTRIKNFGSSLKKLKKKENRQSTQIRNKADDETITINTELVTRSILATDKSGNIISGLTKEDFVISEDGLVQEIEVFSSQESRSIPRSIVLILDVGPHQVPYLKLTIEAVKSLVDNLNVNDEMAIATSDLKLYSDFTNNKTILIEILDSLEKNGELCLKELRKKVRTGSRQPFNLKNTGCLGSGGEFDTLLAVLNEMFDSNDREQIIIFQGDGSAIIWLQDDNESPYKISKSTRDNFGMKYLGNKAMNTFGYKEVKEAIKSSQATIYSTVPGIRFFGIPKKEGMKRAKKSFDIRARSIGIPEFYIPRLRRRSLKKEFEIRTAGQTAMHKTAELSGGFTYFIEKPEDADKVYSEMFETISNRYVVGYYRTDGDQKPRNIKIEIRNHPEYVCFYKR